MMKQITKMQKSVCLVLFTILFSTISCDSTKVVDKKRGVCGDGFRTITVSLKDGEGHPIALDNIMVERVKDHKDISLKPSASNWQVQRDKGAYVLVDDSKQQEYKNKSLKLKFVGIVNKHIAFSADYVVEANSCHVVLASGVPEFSLNILGKWRLIAQYISKGDLGEWKEVKDGDILTITKDKMRFSNEEAELSYAVANFSMAVEKKGVYFYGFEGEDVLTLGSEGCREGCFYKYKRFE